jgi:hypothetical protein
MRATLVIQEEKFNRSQKVSSTVACLLTGHLHESQLLFQYLFWSIRGQTKVEGIGVSLSVII